MSYKVGTIAVGTILVLAILLVVVTFTAVGYGLYSGARPPTDGSKPLISLKFDNKGAPSAEEIKMAAKMIETIAKVISDMADRAGAEGMTPEALKKELAAKMMAVIMSMMAEMEGQPPASAPADQPSTRPAH